MWVRGVGDNVTFYIFILFAVLSVPLRDVVSVSRWISIYGHMSAYTQGIVHMFVRLTVVTRSLHSLQISSLIY